MEWKLFKDGEIPECSTPEWYQTRDRARHLEEDLHRGRLKQAAEYVRRSIFDTRTDEDATRKSMLTETVVDLGSGDGGLLSLIQGFNAHSDLFLRGIEFKCWGYDLQPSSIEGAKERGVDVRLGNATTDDIEWGRIAIATELLEHLVDPHGFVRKIADHSDVLVCSSPWTETPESHYEFHLWAFDPDGYKALLEDNGFKVVDQEFSGMFQILRGIRPSSLARLSMV